MNVNQLISNFSDWYGSGDDGSSPTPEQWGRVLARPDDQPITMVNLFKLRPQAVYSEGGPDISGADAFNRYSSVSIPAMQRNRGTFLFVGPFQGGFVGTDEDWDLVAVGQYPDMKAFVDMQTDADYRACYHHRTAACVSQRVFFCGS